MKSKLLLAVLGAVVLAGACRKAGETNQTAVICEATVLDTAGATVGTLLDTVLVQVNTDSVAGDPRPCKVTTRVNGYTVLNATDSVSGNPKP